MKNTANGTIPKNPKDYLRDESPALYNFIEYYIPNADIIGLSSQGLEYPKENEESYEATKKGNKKRKQEKVKDLLLRLEMILYTICLYHYIYL